MNEVTRQVLGNVLETLELAERHHKSRDEGNAALRATRDIRYSPLTVEIMDARARLSKLLEA